MKRASGEDGTSQTGSGNKRPCPPAHQRETGEIITGISSFCLLGSGFSNKPRARYCSSAFNSWG